jgi:hypothetical protein
MGEKDDGHIRQEKRAALRAVTAAIMLLTYGCKGEEALVIVRNPPQEKTEDPFDAAFRAVFPSSTERRYCAKDLRTTDAGYRFIDMTNGMEIEVSGNIEIQRNSPYCKNVSRSN